MSNMNDTSTGGPVIQVPSAVKNVLIRLKDAIQVNKIRGVSAFFGFGEEKAFNVPAKSEAVKRLTHNTLFFATNYVVILAVLAVITILMHPLFLIVLVGIALGWWNVARLANNDDDANPIMIAGHVMASRERSIGMLVLSAVAVFLFGGSVIFSILTSSGCVIVFHSGLRNYPIPEQDELGFLTALDHKTARAGEP